ncbi:protein kinase domain-containing protein [Microbispora sp. NBC_01389]|uniref:serine/threonine-protein kinase n=1 Tax=Microbispora sp. NBC_01389 TaxID=2903584 RepID=UPI00325523FE
MADAQTSERVVAGRYRLIEPLGRGGMGTVWRAVDQVLEREVAVKELHQSAEMTGTERDVFTVRTFREARAAGRISHPNVAAVYDAFEEGGYPWIVLELVPSRTLGSVIREEGPLPPRRVAEIGSQVLAGLRVAHANGVLHRDVKPDNVLLAEDGRVVLTDFGIAAMEDDSPVTRTGMLVGTPAFIAPERAAGQQAQRASDLWSLGVTLFLAVEGRSPFNRGHALATLAAVMYEDAGPIHRAGPLTQVIAGLLVKDPDLRMTADQAVLHLHAVATGRVADPVVPRPRQAPRLARFVPLFDQGEATAPTPVPVSVPTPLPASVPAPVAGRTPAFSPVSAPAPASPRRRPWTMAVGTGALVALVGVAAGAAAFATARTAGDTRAAAVSVPTVTVFATKTAKPTPGEAGGSAASGSTEDTGSGASGRTATRPVANSGAGSYGGNGRQAQENRGGHTERATERSAPKAKSQAKPGGKAKAPKGGPAAAGPGTPKPAKGPNAGAAQPPTGKGNQGKGNSGNPGNQGPGNQGNQGNGKGTGNGDKAGASDVSGDFPDGYTQPETDWNA